MIAPFALVYSRGRLPALLITIPFSAIPSHSLRIIGASVQLPFGRTSPFN